MGTHRGQSIVLPETSEVLPSGALTSTFIAPEPVQTSNMSCGLTIGEATATPSETTTHANTRRASREKLRKDCRLNMLQIMSQR